MSTMQKIISQTVGVTMLKDEEDIILECLNHHKNIGIKNFVVADNNSKDKSAQLVAEFQRQNPDCTVVFLVDPIVEYIQARKITALCKFAAEYFNLPWVYPFDADEFLTPPSIGEEAHTSVDASGLENAACLSLSWITSIKTRTGQTLESSHESPWRKILVRWDDRYSVLQGNHGLLIPQPRIFRKPKIVTSPVVQCGWKVLHFPVRSQRQLRTKIINGGLANKDNSAGLGGHWSELFSAYEKFGGRILDELYELITSENESRCEKLALFCKKFEIDRKKIAYFNDYFHLTASKSGSQV